MLRRCCVDVGFLIRKRFFFFKITTSTHLRSLRTCTKVYDLLHFLEVWAVDASPCKQACIWSAQGLQAGAVCWRGNRFSKQLRANTHLSLPRSLLFEPEPRAERYTTTTNTKILIEHWLEDVSDGSALALTVYIEINWKQWLMHSESIASEINRTTLDRINQTDATICKVDVCAALQCWRNLVAQEMRKLNHSLDIFSNNLEGGALQTSTLQKQWLRLINFVEAPPSTELTRRMPQFAK